MEGRISNDSIFPASKTQLSPNAELINDLEDDPKITLDQSGRKLVVKESVPSPGMRPITQAKFKKRVSNKLGASAKLDEPSLNLMEHNRELAGLY